MLTLQHPTEADVIRYLLKCKASSFSYDQLGATRTQQFPTGFDVDRHRSLLGYGEETFEIAKCGLRRWQMFATELTTLYWPDQSIRVGAEVAVLFRAGPLWSLNPCRIVYVFDESQPVDGVQRFGFACGTLGGHLESGEEQFSVTWDRGDDSVHYELLAVSRPDHLLTRIGYPHARVVQARFRRLSALAMQRIVHSDEPARCG